MLSQVDLHRLFSMCKAVTVAGYTNSLCCTTESVGSDGLKE
jgi:hypothetical protein